MHDTASFFFHSFSSRLVIHVQVYLLANHLGLEDLQSKARKHFEEQLREDKWDASDLLHAMNIIYNDSEETTSDLRTIVFDHAIDKAESLVENPDFIQGVRKGIYVELLLGITADLVRTVTSLAENRTEVELDEDAEDEREAEIFEATVLALKNKIKADNAAGELMRARKMMNGIKKCTRKGCGTPFDAGLGNFKDGRLFVKCEKCDMKHYI